MELFRSEEMQLCQVGASGRTMGRVRRDRRVIAWQRPGGSLVKSRCRDRKLGLPSCTHWDLVTP